jgi:hypothetical protein
LQALPDVVDPLVDLRIGEVVLAQPTMEIGDAAFEALAPFSIGFEAGGERA